MNRRGFTLIEVLVALAIAAIGLGAAISVVSNATANSSYLRDRVLASWIASNLLTEIRIGPNVPDLNHNDGTVEYANRKWKWESTVTQTQIDGLRRIDITVRDAEIDGSQPIASMSGFIGTTAHAGAMASNGDPFDPTQNASPGNPGTNGGIPVVPATPAITTKTSSGSVP
jgi:general secretion pathway protein I